ncbi:DUF3006 domain-containing protein [Sporomusa acidovorans]|uniref:DUF3006 domain-containing protein n=1 Tax=Sporomusa acidovorans (strain ATCC 49682 / DSM 3132 / Mol) TaxID=1123286 RepID=A0ABZ3J025_SPOA4|nr:DUF3006 domain-containing protein [Sporomusa acidovorans]OZC19165.1 hypothetical protein SPACI_32510 [Sporomusa acidovorans DSM 3132]SDF11864.1 Protein of unknown function [Sporomusa acidovorans]
MEIRAMIDRFEGSKAVLLAGDREISVNWPKELLPTVKEGDVLKVEITVDVEATTKARAEADKLFEEITRQNQGESSQ